MPSHCIPTHPHPHPEPSQLSVKTHPLARFPPLRCPGILPPGQTAGRPHCSSPGSMHTRQLLKPLMSEILSPAAAGAQQAQHAAPHQCAGLAPGGAGAAASTRPATSPPGGPGSPGYKPSTLSTSLEGGGGSGEAHRFKEASQMERSITKKARTVEAKHASRVISRMGGEAQRRHAVGSQAPPFCNGSRKEAANNAPGGAARLKLRPTAATPSATCPGPGAPSPGTAAGARLVREPRGWGSRCSGSSGARLHREESTKEGA
jgi:hypothetical protein